MQTETKKDGTKVETTTAKDGSTSKTTTNPNGSSVTETKAADGSTGTVKTDKDGKTEASAKLSDKAVENAKKSGEPVKAPVEVEATRNSNTAPTVKIELPRNSGDTKVEIPVSNMKPGTVAVLVHADGTEEIVKNSLPTEDGIQLTVNGGATVKIVDNSKDFADTRNHWAKDAIDFVSARGLLNGTSANTFSPNAPTTRAQLWTVLARQADADLTGGATWYENAQNWAKEKGISDGTNPNGTINRAQMVTMLWRAMGQSAAASGASFADVPADSYYARAVAWAIENGITAGVGGGRFAPNSTCTRGQIATFLYRYMK
ncbi:MAG: S-layer homology domain-containing protein [Dysosmobacter sp.]|mgnify:CR=1 FL=1